MKIETKKIDEFALHADIVLSITIKKQIIKKSIIFYICQYFLACKINRQWASFVKQNGIYQVQI
jgi:hypothetical protein